MNRSIAPTAESAEKWEIQLHKGSLELAILAALWSGRLYGPEILRSLEKDSDLIVVEGTVYPLLNRLRALGLLKSEWVESDAGHPRKYYQLTAAGRQRALEMTRICASMPATVCGLPFAMLASTPRSTTFVLHPISRRCRHRHRFEAPH